MLKTVKAGLLSLDDKALVDTVFSIGKLHEGHAKSRDPPPLEALNKHGDFKFFQHLFRETMCELETRLASLSPT